MLKLGIRWNFLERCFGRGGLREQLRQLDHNVMEVPRNAVHFRAVDAIPIAIAHWPLVVNFQNTSLLMGSSKIQKSLALLGHHQHKLESSVKWYCGLLYVIFFPYSRKRPRNNILYFLKILTFSLLYLKGKFYSFMNTSYSCIKIGMWILYTLFISNVSSTYFHSMHCLSFI